MSAVSYSPVNLNSLEDPKQIIILNFLPKLFGTLKEYDGKILSRKLLIKFILLIKKLPSSIKNLKVFNPDSKFYINTSITKRFIINLKYFKIDFINSYNSKFHGIISQLWRIYIMSIIKLVNPKIIISLIDKENTINNII